MSGDRSNESRSSREPRRRIAGWRVLPFIGIAMVLAACGGSDDGSPPAPAPVASNQPPASAAASADGFIAFLKTVVVTMPETTSPLDVADFVAPTSDTASPDPTV